MAESRVFHLLRHGCSGVLMFFSFVVLFQHGSTKVLELDNYFKCHASCLPSHIMGSIQNVRCEFMEFLQCHPNGRAANRVDLAALSLGQVRASIKLHKQIIYLVEGFVVRLTSHHAVTGGKQERINRATSTISAPFISGRSGVP